MRRLISLTLAMTATLVMGCGSGDTANTTGGNFGNTNGGAYQGFVLGRVKLEAGLQPGPVEVRTLSGDLLHTAQADRNGFFYYRGTLPADFRVLARRGSDVYQTAHFGGWSGGTIYVNAATTLACAYLQAHPNADLKVAEEKLRRFYHLPANFPMSWVAVVRARGFNSQAFFRSVRSAGSLDAYLNILIAQIDSGLAPKSLLSGLIETVGQGLVSATANDAVGSAVAKMGDNFTTAGALSNIEAGLAIVSAQITALSNEFNAAATYANLASRLQPLALSASNLNLAAANVSLAATQFQASHPNASDYNVPSNYSAIQSTISEVQNLKVQDESAPIVANITTTGPNGLYQALLAEQMAALGQTTDKSYNGYPWRHNGLTQQQQALMGNFITSLGQAAYLNAEFANLQTDHLADAINQAQSQVADLALAVQKGAQQVPDLLCVDELILDPSKDLMWLNAIQAPASDNDAKDFGVNLQVGPYADFGLPSEGALRDMVNSRIIPATSGLTLTGTANGYATFDNAPDSTWINAFEKMGIDASHWSKIVYSGGVTEPGEDDNEGFFFNSQGFDSESTNYNTDAYFINNTGTNPSTDEDTNGKNLMGLYCRIYGGAPEINPDHSLVSAVALDQESPPSGTPTNDYYFISNGPSPYSCLIGGGGQTLVENGQVTTTDATNTTVPLGVQMMATMEFEISTYTDESWGTNWDVTQRAYWTSSNSTAASVSNFVPTVDQNGITLNQGPVPGPCGFVTWHPPFDGSATPPVTISASVLVNSLDGSSTSVKTVQAQVSPPAGLKPVLNTVYATPNNRIINLFSTPATLTPITLIAIYKDGRVVDVSQDADTTWTLKDANGNVLNSNGTGGFGVVNNSSKNALYLSSGIGTSTVTYTGTYNGRWGSASFTGTMALIKTGPTVTAILPSHGPKAGGNSIQIRGTNFTNPTTVTFNNVQATTRFVTPEQLAVTVPASSVGGEVTVKVTTSDGSSSGDSTYFYDE